MILKVTSNKRSMLLINAYRRTDDAEATLRIIDIISRLDHPG